MTGQLQSAVESVARRPASRRGRFTAFGVLLVATMVAWGSNFVYARVGADGFVIALGVCLGLTLYAIVSFRDLAIPFYVWLVVIGGFRFIWAIQAPVLPDMTLDRITLIWLAIVTMVKFVSTRRALVRFGKLEALLIAHCAYIFARVAMDDMTYVRFWSMSNLIPYVVFFFAKNIIVTRKHVHVLFTILFALSVYYHVTSVAEKLNINWLLWPAYMREDYIGFMGRSCGPFLQAPLFGTIIGMMLPLHFYFFAKVRAKPVKGLIFASLLLGFAGLYFTYTRGSWLAGFLAVSLAAVLNRRRYLPVATASIVVGTVLAVAVLGVGQDKFMKERVENEDTIQSRLGIAVTAFRVWQSEPLFGVGYFRYRTARDDYMQPTSLPVVGTIRLRQVRGVSLHDIYLGPLAEDGLVGFGMQMGIYWLILVGLWRRLKRAGPDDDFARYVLPVVAGIYVGYLVGGLAIDYRYFSFVGALFYMAAGIQDGYDPERGEFTGDPAADGAR
ncbi:MAG: O-antigen ligase family protein [Krumholzibacteria bacterium]|nr:O-antigen ligase family protein [Candidatus Krumholzibacteria bacterium]